MTTLRRELRKKIGEKIDAYLSEKNGIIDWDSIYDIAADAAMSVAGIAKAENKFRDPTWDLMHGKTPESQDNTNVYDEIATRLEIGLRRGEFPQSNDAQGVYRWIAEREKSGQSLDRFISWAMEGRRAEFSFIYHKDPRLIKRDWAQVYPNENVEIATPDDDGGYR